MVILDVLMNTEMLNFLHNRWKVVISMSMIRGESSWSFVARNATVASSMPALTKGTI